MNEHETNGFIPNDDAIMEQPTETVACPKCEKRFKNAIALRMHDIRKHQDRGWSTTQNFGKRQSREQVLAKKREYNRKWRLHHGMKVRPKALKGTPWSPERRRKYLKTMKQNSMRKVGATMFEAGGKPPTTTPGLVTFCPRCGTNIKMIAAAMAFGDSKQ